MPITPTLPSDAVALYVRASPSTSLADKIYAKGTSSGVSALSKVASTGASFTGFTTRLKLPESVN